MNERLLFIFLRPIYFGAGSVMTLDGQKVVEKIFWRDTIVRQYAQHDGRDEFNDTSFIIIIALAEFACVTGIIISIGTLNIRVYIYIYKLYVYIKWNNNYNSYHQSYIVAANFPPWSPLVHVIKTRRQKVEEEPKT